MSNRIDWLIWLALLALLALTLAAVQLPLGGLRLVIHFGCALAMAGLMMAFYMDLRRSDGLMRLFALGGLAWLALFLGITLAEILGRGPG